MNRKGFTLIELIATLVILGIVAGISIVGINGSFGSAKNKTEDVFVETIKDALDMYLSDGNPKSHTGGKLSFSLCDNKLSKTHGDVAVYYASTKFLAVINSKYKPILQSDLVNPANEETCEEAYNIPITVYRDADYVYYYSVDKSMFGCLTEPEETESEKISNLPEGYVCN